MEDNVTIIESDKQHTMAKPLSDSSPWHKFFDAFSLSGAIVFVLASIVFTGIFRNNEKIYEQGLTALTTFISARKVNEIESQQKKNG